MNTAPISVFSIDFGSSISLYDPATDQVLNNGPHWIKDTRNAPVAFVRDSGLTLSVTFLDIQATDLGLTAGVIGATGTSGGVVPKVMGLVFDSASGISQSVSFELTEPLPDTIGVHEYHLDWYFIYTKISSEGIIISDTTYAIGSSRHIIYTTWKPIVQKPREALYGWIYEPIMRWSCAWAAGQQNEKAICDVLIRQLPESGLSYGMGALSQTVQALLLRGGGMCGAWYQFFQQLAHCQGVYVYRRDLTIVTSQFGQDQLWTGGIITASGINQPVPAVDPYTFDVDDGRFPIGTDPVQVSAITAQWYVFRGQGQKSVGPRFSSTHAINFLEYDGQVFLYDPSFAAGPYPFAGPVPGTHEFMSGAQLAPFKETYLNERFAYLMGSIHNGSRFYKTDWSQNPPIYGLLVAIGLISPDEIIIGWSENVP